MAAVRIDKWLWAIRVYKTRTQASEACQKGRILIDNVQVKPSRIIKMGDIVVVRKMPVIYTYEVTGLIEKRSSASEAQKNFKDLTTLDELNKLKIKDTFFIIRDRGTGRPTKRDRRQIVKLLESPKADVE